MTPEEINVAMCEALGLDVNRHSIIRIVITLRPGMFPEAAITRRIKSDDLGNLTSVMRTLKMEPLDQ